MTALEKYMQEIKELVSKLDNIGCFGCSEETLELVEQASFKLKEMMSIVLNAGIANGAMASALQIISRE